MEDFSPSLRTTGIGVMIIAATTVEVLENEMDGIPLCMPAAELAAACELSEERIDPDAEVPAVGLGVGAIGTGRAVAEASDVAVLAVDEAPEDVLAVVDGDPVGDSSSVV